MPAETLTMPLEEALIAARPLGPKGLELDGPSLVVQDRIARARVGTYPVNEDGLVVIETASGRGYLSEGAVLPMTWEHPVVPLVANIAAFVLGMTDKKNATPTIEYMRRKGRVIGRNADTAEAFKAVATGSRQEADPIIKSTYLGHVQVHEWAKSHAGGPHPERAAYDPFDNDRAEFTIACLGWGTEKVFEAIVRPLSDSERQRFREIDQPLFGGLFGSEAPKDHDALIRKRIEGGELHLTEAARVVAMLNWYNLPLPRSLLLVRKPAVQLVLGILPQEVREMYGLDYGPKQEKQFHKAAARLSLANKALRLTTKDADKWLFEAAAGEEQRLKPEIPDPYA